MKQTDANKAEIVVSDPYVGVVWSYEGEWYNY
jgi:hypothetical protein